MVLNSNQPKSLYLILAICLAERFAFFLVNGLLVLYMLQRLLLTNTEVYGVFASFSALLYLSPLVAGFFSTRMFDIKRMTLIGSLVLAVGYFLLSISTRNYLYIGMALIISGKGLFSPNLIILLSKLYQHNDLNRANGFSLFYSTMNIAAFIPSIISAIIISYFGWHIIFITAGTSVLIGTILLYGLISCSYELKKFNQHNITLNSTVFTLFYLIGGILFYKKSLSNCYLSNCLLCIIGSITIGILIKKTLSLNKDARKSILNCFFLILFSIIFYIMSQQSVMSLTVYTEYNVNRQFFIWNIPTPVFQALNPLTIILCTHLFSGSWMNLNKMKINPSAAVKFSLGTCLTGLGFIVLVFAMHYSTLHKINFSWLVLSYCLQSVGELLICATGMAMITSFSQKDISRLMIGIWYFVIAISSKLSGIISEYTIPPSNKYLSEMTYSFYANIYTLLGVLSILSGIMLFFLYFINKIYFNRKIVPILQ